MLKFTDELDIENQLVGYQTAWQKVTAKFPEGLKESVKSTTLSIKVADKDSLFQLLSGNYGVIDQVHIGTVDKRYIASAILKDPYQGLPIFKILERRSGSEDPLGLDSLDYYCKDINEVYESLKQAGLPVIKEENDVHQWLSLRFGEEARYEAKFTDHLLTEVATKELNLATTQLTALLGL